jgi:hypothetical protein
MQPTPQNNQLMSKHRVLSLKPQLRLEWRGQDGQSETEQPDHSASLGDSIRSSTRIRFSVHTTLTRRPHRLLHTFSLIENGDVLTGLLGPRCIGIAAPIISHGASRANGVAGIGGANMFATDVGPALSL